MKTILLCIFIFVAASTFVPLDTVIAQEGLSQMSQCSGTDCSACNIVHMANGIIKWLIGILFVIFAILVAVAGVKLVVSGGNHHALDEAKGMFMNAIIGFIIILSAWLIVDTIMRALVGTEERPGQLAIGGKATGYLFWSQVQCQKLYTPSDKGNETLNYEPVFTEADNLISATNIANITTVSPAGVYHASSDVAPDGQLDYQSGVSSQRSHASNELEMLLRCMTSQLPANVGQISSISEKAIANGSKTFAQCWAGGCQHVAGSCHYGNGYGVVGKSYAVDFGDENHAQDIMGAASACGAKAAAVHNGNHVHVTTRACKGI